MKLVLALLLASAVAGACAAQRPGQARAERDALAGVLRSVEQGNCKLAVERLNNGIAVPALARIDREVPDVETLQMLGVVSADAVRDREGRAIKHGLGDSKRKVGDQALRATGSRRPDPAHRSDP